jgi:cyclophilin family peptidyl-prolyl cis-trans isomerase
MTKWYLMFSLLLCVVTAQAENPVVEMHTTAGLIVIELDQENAPISVQNFLNYVSLDQYQGAIFHRVIPGFMIQTGGYYETLSEMDEGEYIRNEADNGLKNLVGTVAMARTDEIDSAGRQFFINVNRNTHLDHSSESCTRKDEKRRLAAAERGLYLPQSCRSFGYTVFGRVIEGMDVVRQIERLPTEERGDFTDIPIETVTVEKIVKSSE